MVSGHPAGMAAFGRFLVSVYFRNRCRVVYAVVVFEREVEEK
jgi:hypothetical protein